MVKQLTEQVYRIVTGATINNSRKIDEREADLAVNQAIAFVAKKNYWENKNLEGVGYIDGQFIVSYENVAVSYNPGTCEHYSVLPAIPAGLPRNGGVVQVSGMKGQTKPFYPVETTWFGTFPSLETSKIPGIVYYSLENNKIKYTGLAPITKKVLIKLAATGDCTVPADWQNEVITIALKILGVEQQVPQDKTNDALDKA